MSLAKTLSGNAGISFVILDLTDAGGQIVSHNAYWLTKSNNYKPLRTMPAATVETKISGMSMTGTEKEWTLTVTNTSDKVAFFIRPQVMQEGEEIMPSYWSAGYFTLAPSQSITLNVRVPGELADQENAWIRISGWNVAAEEISLK